MPQETFLTAANPPAPLAERLRPQNLDEFAGQEHLIGKGKVLRRMIEGDLVSSMIFWGPPGVGKTTLAQIIAHQTKSHFINFSAVTSGIKEIRQVMEQAESDRHFGIRTIVFVDEIHRFNKAQQDAFLPYVEKGSIILIGATTENPSFEVNSALLSRCRVFVLHALTEENVLGCSTAPCRTNAASADRKSTWRRICCARSRSSPTATREPPYRRWKWSSSMPIWMRTVLRM